MFEYIVVCDEVKNIIRIREKREIYEAITATFKLHPQTELILEVWDSTCEEYVEVEDVSSLPDACKINASIVLASYTLPKGPPGISSLTGR